MTLPAQTVPTALRRAPIAGLFAGGLALLLAGCAQNVSNTDMTGAIPVDYRTSHPITIAEQLETIDIPVSADTARLSEGIRQNIVGFAQKFRASGSAVVAIIAPSGSPNEIAAAALSMQAKEVLLEAGVRGASIEYRSYQAAPMETLAPIRMAYSKVAATTAPCGLWNQDMARTFENGNYQGFGCATQQNLAAIVANPLDLLYPRAVAPADVARRASMLGKYREGSTFISSPANTVGGSVSVSEGQ